MEVIRQIEHNLDDPYWQDLWTTPASTIASRLDQSCQEKIKCQHELLIKVASQSSE